MKQFIWMLCGIFLSGLLLGTLSACGADQIGVSVITTGGERTETVSGPEDRVPADETEPEDAPADRVSPEGGGAVTDGDTARRLAYANVLEDALSNGLLPGGEKLDWISAEDAAENEFALADVDGDGEEELLLRWTNASMAGTADFVFRFDGEAVSEEFLEFAGVEFYTNGAAKAAWSHNQGWAGRFWPFNLYQYDQAARTYVEAGVVDAWDRSLFEDDEVLSAAFPAEADKDGDGLVYYILTGDWYNRQRTPSDGNLDGRLWDTDPVDGAEMEDWLSGFIDGAELIQLPLQKLTAENIAGLG